MSTDLAELPRTVDLDAISSIDNIIRQFPLAECREVKNRFTPGLYTREIIMHPGVMYRSKVHNSHHQFIISHGTCLVSTNGSAWVMNVAPYHGETVPGNWRVILPLSVTYWTTLHSTLKTSAEEIENDIIMSEEKNEAT